jgi:hypothetical protein
LRIPVQSEADAFRWVFGIAFVLLLAVVLGAATEPVYGVVLVAVAVMGVLGWEFGTRDPDASSPLRDAARSGGDRSAHDRHRVLVIANETVAGAELQTTLIQRLEQSPEIRVVCPILPSRAHYITSDIDRELADARSRLDRTLAWATQSGLRAHGQVSPATPLEAVADALRSFPADEIIVSTHPAERSRWLESGLVEQLRADLDIPVHHVVVDVTRQPERGGVR